MLRAIQFHYKPGFCTVKIYNILSKWALAAKLDIVMPQEAIPQQIFLFCGIFPQLL